MKNKVRICSHCYLPEGSISTYQGCHWVLGVPGDPIPEEPCGEIIEVEEDYYPEHEKLHKIRAQSQAVGEFIKWLQDEKDTHLCSVRSNEDYTVLVDLLIPKEVVAASETPREEYTIYRPAYLLSIPPLEDLLAEFFIIDRKKLEEEKKEMLKKYRDG